MSAPKPCTLSLKTRSQYPATMKSSTNHCYGLASVPQSGTRSPRTLPATSSVFARSPRSSGHPSSSLCAMVVFLRVTFPNLWSPTACCSKATRVSRIVSTPNKAAPMRPRGFANSVCRQWLSTRFAPPTSHLTTHQGWTRRSSWNCPRSGRNAKAEQQASLEAASPNIARFVYLSISCQTGEPNNFEDPSRRPRTLALQACAVGSNFLRDCPTERRRRRTTSCCARTGRDSHAAVPWG